MSTFTLCDVLVDGRRTDLAVADGVVVSEPAPGAERLDASGYVAIPRLTDAHVHLDKALIGPTWHPHLPGTSIAERTRRELEVLGGPGVAPVYERAERLLRLAIARGSTRVQSHVDISAELGLDRLHPLLQLREDYRGVVDLTFVAFPQGGILASPGTFDLLDEALRLGVEAVGGLDPISRDGDADAHLDAVFELAVRHHARVDVHLHDQDEAGTTALRAITHRTIEHGLTGRVAVSHGFVLGALPHEEMRRTAAGLAEAGITLVTNVPGRSPRPPITELAAAGLNVVIASDNVRDAWSPYGTADMLERVALAGYLFAWEEDESIVAGLDHVTVNPSMSLGDELARLRVGDPADLTLVPAHSLMEAVVAHPGGRRVYRRGRLVAVDGDVVSAPLSYEAE